MPTELVVRILSYLHRNTIACTARLVCKDARQQFSDPQYRLVRLSEPLPRHAATLARHWEEGVRGLTFINKLLLFSTAAASGCEANLELVLHLLQPSLLPEMLRTRYYASRFVALEQEPWYQVPLDPGSVAVRHGHAHLLPWMVTHAAPLVPHHTLTAAAQHCDLAVLQLVWGVLRPLVAADRAAALELAAVAAARRSPGDAIPMVDWLARQQQQQPLRQPRQQPGAASGFAVWGVKVAAAAAAAGSIELLTALAARGVAWKDPSVLAAAVQHAPLSVARWLEVGGLDAQRWAGGADSRRAVHLAALASGDVDKVVWVERRFPAGLALAPDPAASEAAAASGSVALLQHLVRRQQLQLGEGVMVAAVRAGRVEAASYLLGRGCTLNLKAFSAAARNADVAMMRWVAQHLGERLQQHLGGLSSRLFMHWPPAWREPRVAGAAAGSGQEGAHGDGSGAVEAGSGAAGGPGGCSRRAWGTFMQAAAVVQQHINMDTLVPAAARVGCVEYLDRWGDERWQSSWDMLRPAAAGGCARVLARVLDSMGEHRSIFGQHVVYIEVATAGDRATLEALVRGGVSSQGTLREAIRQRAPLCALQHMVALGVRVSKGARTAARLRLRQRSKAAGPDGGARDNAEVRAWLESLPVEDDAAYDDDYGPGTNRSHASLL